MNDEEKEPVDIITNGITIHIPACCSEGRADCKHSVQKTRPEKTNIAL